MHFLSCPVEISMLLCFCSRLDDQIKQMEKEQGEKMKLWPEKTDPLDKWLIKNETTVQSYEPIGYDISYVKTQEKNAQVGAFSNCLM